MRTGPSHAFEPPTLAWWAMFYGGENTVTLGALESAVMRVCWEAQAPVTVRAVLDRLNEGRERPLAYTTVMTVMTRLAEKRMLDRAIQGRGYAYTATVADEACEARIIIAPGQAAYLYSLITPPRTRVRKILRLAGSRTGGGCP
ncbi:BlaI/MecI/CopY family transcriptional regulator [Streptomyces sp. NBS 14/10]|uniref:BlaI/MecI/CopY family transcriptional regulator n=1 Tax=Streptomyces sp. NBS 14/10 TaxID=1945643 RepID=UPI00211ACFA3|nr:BlaI/MecI/CopY family transcriptional regulator [Streptomyces sp. NBS 14/10]KAK1185795.1 BlaI/MecI/CopY family transcriptional regulator [Streptomyces sp. NBS 14/10]